MLINSPDQVPLFYRPQPARPASYVEGKVLSQTAADRVYLRDEKDDDDEGSDAQSIHVVIGTAASCSLFQHVFHIAGVKRRLALTGYRCLPA